MGKSQKTPGRFAVGYRIAVGMMGNPADCRKAGIKAIHGRAVELRVAGERISHRLFP
jgi:hypothetical protein